MKQPEIIELLLTHDERGMEALLLHYGPLMRYVIAPILPDAHDQADCVHRTAQIAWELGLTERAVEGRLYRLKQRLRKTWGGEAHE